MRQYRQQFEEFFAWTFVGARAATLVKIAFTMTFDLNVGIAKLTLLITLCAASSVYIPHWNFQLHCLISLQICPLSKTRKGDSFSLTTSP